MQLWMVDYPAGSVRRITNDLAAYGRVDITADGRTLVAMRAETSGTLWVGPAGQPESAAALAGVPGNVTGGVQWTSDGRIVYAASMGDNLDVWSVPANGRDARQLTTSPGIDNLPSVSPDSRYVVFTSNRDGRFRLWRMDADGGRQAPLTSGPLDGYPVVAGDGRSVYFQRSNEPGSPMYTVPIDGGAPVLFSQPPQGGQSASVPDDFGANAVSPDGTLLLGLCWDQNVGRSRLVIVSSDRRAPARWFDAPLGQGNFGREAWAPDGRSVTFVRLTGAALTLWRQPLAGGAPIRVGNLPGNDPVSGHAWSPDGKWLALVRGVTARDVVVIKDLGK
jgi:Tol biopolymer transport system component